MGTGGAGISPEGETGLIRAIIHSTDLLKMLAPDDFLTSTLRDHPRGEAVRRILAAAVNAVEAQEVIRRHVVRRGDELVVSGESVRRSDYDRLFILSFGKAGLGMARALSNILANWPHQGLVVTKHASDPAPACLSVMEGGHPIPDEASLNAGRRTLELVESLHAGDLLFCLISGGGSALVTCPVEGVRLADLQELTFQLLACGAAVDEINILRRALDRVKGGGLVQACKGARVISLILSDVIGDPLEAIASGPTVLNPTTHLDALKVIDKYGLRPRLPPAILTALADEARGSSLGDFSRVRNLIVGSNRQAADAALTQAAQEGFNVHLLRTDLRGEARDAGHEMVQALRAVYATGRPVSPPACIIAGGETTVTLRGRGLGGRNQELALAAAVEMVDLPDAILVSFGTDGEDGPTDAAGAVATSETLKRAEALGLSAEPFLENNDSHPYFDSIGDLLKPGPTGTNANDLTLLFAF
jgi:glycerate 2-kinase